MKLFFLAFGLVGTLSASAWGVQLTTQQLEQVKKATHGYEFAKKSLVSFLKRQASPRENEFMRKLRDCQIRNVGDGESQLLEGEHCGVAYQVSRQTVDRGVNENGDTIVDEVFEDEFEIKDEALVQLVGLRSWKVSSTARSDTLVSTPAEVNVHKVQIHLLTADSKEVEIGMSGRTYVNTETSEHTIFRAVDLFMDEDISTTANFRVVLMPHDAPKNIRVEWDSKPATLEAVLDTFTRTVLSYPFGSENKN